MKKLNLGTDSRMESILDSSHSKKIIMINLRELKANIYNLDMDTEEEVRTFAEAVYEEGGIREPLHAYRDEELNRYVILGGHKRYYACLLNSAKYKDAQTTVPVIVEDKPKNVLEERLMIDELNETRNYDDRKLLIRARNLYEIYTELARQGKKPAGEKRKWFAKRLSCGEKKAERFIHIIEGRYDEKETKLKNAPDRNYEDVRVHLQRKLSTKIRITKNRIILSYTDVDDFNRILEAIGCENIVNE